jgi:DNA-binding beta-propeller fold protein YncE
MYSLASTLSGFSGPAGVTATMYVGLLCSDDGGGTTTSSPMHGTLILSASGAFTLVSTANGETDESGYTVGINAPNDCGKNTWTLKLTAPSTLSCSVQGANTGTFITSNGGNTNVAASPPTVSCSPLFTIGGAVTGLTAGAVVLQDNGGDTLTVASGSPSFTFATPLATGATYDVSVETQPAGFNCTVTPSGAQTVGSSNVTTVAVACTPVAVMSSPQSSAVYVIDSTYTLFEFDPSGHLIASVKLPGQAASVGTLNGGGITVDANNVYVTLGAPSTGIAAFTRATLQPVTLGAGAFAGLNTPRGIVFDPANAQFYVANGGSTVTTYDDSGTATGSFLQSGGIYGPSGIAYDATDNALWVANYTGGGSSVSPQYGIADFTAGGSLIANFPTAASPAGTPFAPPNNTGHEMPYWISYCGSSLAVGFISDSSGSGISEAAGYSTAGALLGAGYAGITNLHAMACAPAGNVYVAADNGLLQFNTVSGASVALPSGGFAGLTAPIYGVGVALSGGLNSPEGLAYANGLLYVANSGNNQVQVYKVTTSASSGAVTGMTLSSIITADLNDPVRLALDAGGHLFVANAANNTVTAYDTANGNAEIKAPGGAALISGGSLNRPLGVTVDSVGNLYVANNASDTVSVYKPNTAGSVAAGYTEAAFSPLSADTAGNAFDGPGALTDAVIAGQNYLLLGTGAGGSHVFIYAAPFTGVPAPVYNLSNVTNGMTCSTMPVGPTGIAVYVDPAQPLSSQILVSSLFGNEVADYVASQVIGTSNTCPTPITTAAGSGVSSPEGVAIDSAGQNVFVANSATNTITVYGAGAALNGPAVYTLQN